MFAKHFINIIYFIQVLGWNKIFSYLKHEFFTIRNRRSFVGGHLSNRTPSFLLMPLRVWLGAVWLFEGIKKILEGWFGSPKLNGFFNGANGWYESILNGGAAADAVSSATGAAADAVSSATGAAADAVSSATGAVGEAVRSVGTAILNFDFLGLFKAIFVSGKAPAESALADYAFKLDVPLVNSFINNLILPNESVQMFMQIFIVVAEILIGLALIGGLFTTPASAASLILQAMFVTTTGLYLNTFWMVFAAIALLIAAGSTLGLDYYAMPALKRKWKNVKWARKWYLYHD
jgi:NADH dehydrogenase